MQVATKSKKGFLDIFSTKGRVNRSRFLLLSGVALALEFVNFAIGSWFGKLFEQTSSIGFMVGQLAFVLTGMLAFIALVILIEKRCHDCDRHGAMILMLAVPILNIAFLLYLFCKQGTVGPNKFGSDPLEGKS